MLKSVTELIVNYDINTNTSKLSITSTDEALAQRSTKQIDLQNTTGPNVQSVPILVCDPNPEVDFSSFLPCSYPNRNACFMDTKRRSETVRGPMLSELLNRRLACFPELVMV